MLFSILHTSCYTYSAPVSLGPHVLRFQPREDGTQRVEQFQLQILPMPAGLSQCLDVENNAVTSAWFTGQHRQLSIAMQASVRTLRDNPFDYLIQVGNDRLPVRYGPDCLALLAPALAGNFVAGDPVRAMAETLRERSENLAGPFLDLLNRTLYENCPVAYRENGDPWPAAVTLARKGGACRDLAVLFMEACRSVGLAARFVSGYQDAGAPEPELHAWAEVYIPGAGWRGYDPAQGLAVADRHIAVATSALPSQAAPITGAFHGAATATLQTQVQVQAIATA